MPATVYIPVPDWHGVYRYPDGSGFMLNTRVRKWNAWWAPSPDGARCSRFWRNTPSGCVALCGDNDEQSWFATKEEAAQAIADGGEGPAVAPSLENHPCR